MTALFESRELATAVADKLKVYAQPQRLMILSCLLAGERTVTDIGEATGIGQPALSQQLAELRRAEVVGTRKEAKQVWYALSDDFIASCVRTMEQMFGSGVPMPPMASPPDKAPIAPHGAAAFARVG